MKNYEVATKPWITSACPGGDAPVGTPAIRLTVHGLAMVARQASVPAQKPALRGRTAVGGYASVTGTPAVPAKRNMTQLFTNSGLRGPHPWREPVIT